MSAGRVCRWSLMTTNRQVGDLPHNCRSTWRRSLTCGKQRGSELLAVLWLSAALSAIAFTVANTVRAETERTSTEVDSLRAYYLAAGAIDRAIVHIEWGPGYRNPDGSSKFGGQGPL